MVKRSLSLELLEQIREQRKKLTKAEALLWESLRDCRLGGYKFRRQHPAGGYNLDFYCPAARLRIEVNGGVYREIEQAGYDRQRSEDLTGLGEKGMRFWNSEVANDLDRVLEQIHARVVEEIALLDGVRSQEG
jgi:very-short-patch-repair endonuclease